MEERKDGRKKGKNDMKRRKAGLKEGRKGKIRKNGRKKG